ncbi:hypothetical protein VIGAN_05234600 [Vigna angularis var. angularis]|uniref:Uncharacterized protein n=1 Tax=Vigna angularis var. angularis TaxID=157739 RepID=A0A0S3S7G0_PHAAN|nr:hypothetical protein VIGAN_05234600 [Vigna angularis var. angularis]
MSGDHDPSSKVDDDVGTSSKETFSSSVKTPTTKVGEDKKEDQPTPKNIQKIKRRESFMRALADHESITRAKHLGLRTLKIERLEFDMSARRASWRIISSIESIHEVESRGRGNGGGLTVKTNPTAGGRVDGGSVGLVALGDGGSRDVVAARGTGGGGGGENRVAEGSVGEGIKVSLALGGVTGGLLDILKGGRLAGIEVMLRMNGMRKEEGFASMRVGLGKMNGGEGRSYLVCGRGFEARNPLCFGG